jgi:acyl phosphate:glycerol-3-phosphate acyltransferase
MLVLSILIVALAGYLLGAIPFAVIIARHYGVDILKVGSGNPGATNVKRSVGKGAGNLCFVLDALKGVAAVAWPMIAFQECASIDPLGATGMGIIGLCSALAGHSASVFIRFKGGKGVATTIGGMLALCPLVILIGIAVWLSLFYWKRYVSLASLSMAASLPLAAWFLDRYAGASWFFGCTPAIFYFTLLIAILLFVRHRSNIARLWNGKENRFEKTPKD